MIEQHISAQFIDSLFAHPRFGEQLSVRLKSDDSARIEPCRLMGEVVEEISSLLVLEYKTSIDSASSKMTEAYGAVLKQIEEIKMQLQNKPGLLSQMTETSFKVQLKTLADSEQANLKRQFEAIEDQFVQNSLNGTILSESIIKDSNFEQNLSIANLEMSLGKVEQTCEDKLDRLQQAFMRKVETIYKSLNTILQSIADLEHTIRTPRKEIPVPKPPVQRNLFGLF